MSPKLKLLPVFPAIAVLVLFFQIPIEMRSLVIAMFIAFLLTHTLVWWMWWRPISPLVHEKFQRKSVYVEAYKK